MRSVAIAAVVLVVLLAVLIVIGFETGAIGVVQHLSYGDGEETRSEH
ncbi:MAG: hypothetical protein QOJ65_884 [Fimbriimonadaceae bacterium]|jgi:hypothetical protein|nr:hypothetical protein [Fimbriimonadaceae bacterium]